MIVNNIMKIQTKIKRSDMEVLKEGLETNRWK